MRKGIDITNEFMMLPSGTDIDSDETATLVSKPSTDTREVFVVHGRNQEARRAMFEFLRAIGLYPLEWIEAVRATGKPMP